MAAVAAFERGARIGEGTFGSVYRGTERATGRTVAIKRFHPKWMGTRQGVHFTAIREIRHLNELRHPNIVELAGIIERDAEGYFSLVFEHCVGDLEGVIRRTDLVLRPADVKAYMQMLLSAVGFLHVHAVLHRDLKPGNILVAPSGALKLADFGTARALSTAADDDAELTPNIVTRWYQSPELLLGARRYGPAVDAWSLGCIFAELHLRRAPFPGSSALDQLMRICSQLGTPAYDAANTWPGWDSLPDAVQFKPVAPRPLGDLFATGIGSAAGAMVPPRDALELIGGLLSLSPLRRMSCADALASAYFETNAPLPTALGALPMAVSQ